MAQWDWGSGKKGVTSRAYAFVIDTDEYAGNFSRELCAYVVGEVDEYANVPEMLALFKKDHPESPFKGLIQFRHITLGDDANFDSPCDLAPTPGRVNNGNGKHFDEKKYKGKTPYPAYESVAIFLSRKPTEQQLKLLASRARSFSTLPKIHPWDDRPKVLGCRLVCVVTSLEVTVLTEEKGA